MKHLFLTCCICLALTPPVFAQPVPPEIRENFSDAKRLGTTRAKLFAIPIYNAELWVKNGAAFSFNAPFVLTIRYEYAFRADLLVRTSVQEMARMEQRDPSEFEEFAQRLRPCLNNINKRDRVTGIAKGDDLAIFYVNGRKSCTLKFPKVRERFFSIWLGDKTRDPSGAAKLKGLN